MLSLATRTRQAINIWPGFVDALASILMVFIFMLLIFVVAQFFLSDIVINRDRALEQLSRNVHELLDALSVERGKRAALQNQVRRLTTGLEASRAERDELIQRLALVTQKAESTAAQAAQLRDRLDEALKTVAADKQTIELKLREIASLQEDIAALRKLRGELENQIGTLAATLEQRDTDLSTAQRRSSGLESQVGELEQTLKQREQDLLSVRDRSKALEARLADEQERTRLAQKMIKDRKIRIQALTARIATYDKALVEQKELSADARAQVDLLNQQIAALRQQIASLSVALELSESAVEEYKVEVAELGRRLNLALAQKVEELQEFRSEFFGRLRAVLGDHPDIRIVGDRFLFQSELLFPSASAALEPAGRRQLDQLASTLLDISNEIPSDVDWILRVDGHTDRRPIHTLRFPSNWELSTARALSIVNYLIQRGIPPQRLAAAGFGEFRPLDERHTAQAYSRNRRIEIKLTGP